MKTIESAPKHMATEETDLKVIMKRLKALFPGGCQRILIANIPQVNPEDFDKETAELKRYPCFPPYGAGLLVSNLKVAGYHAHIIDLNYEILSRVHDPKFRYDCWQDCLSATVESFKPDLVGLSCMFSANHNAAKIVIDWLKQTYRSLPVIAGGVHVTTNIRTFLEDVDSLDLAIAYEADETFVNSLDCINGRARVADLGNVHMIIGGRYLFTKRKDFPDGARIDRIPDFGELPIGQYSQYGEIGAFGHLRPENFVPIRSSTISLNRGCRANCTYCSVHSVSGRARSRSAVAVVSEIGYQMKRYGINHFMLLDDDPWNGSALEIFKLIRKKRFKITWDASNGVIARMTTPEIIEAAFRSGCIGFGFGIESGDPDILRSVNKPSTVEDFIRVGQLMKRYPRIFCKGFLMVGFPGETVRQIWNTINLAVTIDLDWYTIQIRQTFAESKLTRKLIADGLIDPRSLLSKKMHVGPTGGQHRKELEEQKRSQFQVDILDLKFPDRVPTEDQLPDVWFIMDWLINYRSMMEEENPLEFDWRKTNISRLALKRRNLEHIMRRSPGRNQVALVALFLGIIDQELGCRKEADQYFKTVDDILRTSAFWRVRFQALGINRILAGRREM